MGDPKRLRKKYSTPIHPWDAENIQIEKELSKEYGLKNKREIWKANSLLKKYKDIAKKLIAVKTKQGEKEKKQMIDKLQKWGLIQAGAELDDVLGLEVKDILERRLQSLVFRKGLARSMEQARQFITHQHIMVGAKKITFPSYITSQEEESQIRFDPHSSLSKEDHPERINLAVQVAEELEAVKRKKKKTDTEEALQEEKLKSPIKRKLPKQSKKDTGSLVPAQPKEIKEELKEKNEKANK